MIASGLFLLATLVIAVTVPSTSGAVAPNAPVLTPSSQSQNQGENRLKELLSSMYASKDESSLIQQERRPNIAALRKALKGMSEEDLKAFTPPPVVNPQCYVEVEVVQRFPGKCVMLGGKIPGCQAQEWLSVYSEECTSQTGFQ